MPSLATRVRSSARVGGVLRIGEGVHERAVIDRARFDKRVREKAGGQPG
jgi:predicted thioesterase